MRKRAWKLIISAMVLATLLAAILCACTPEEEGADPQTFLSLTVQGEIPGGGNPVLELQLTNDIHISGNLSKDDIVLGGALASMSVQEVEVLSSGVRITLGGEADLDGERGEGSVTLDYTAMSDGNYAQAKVSVLRYYHRYTLSDFTRMRKEGKILSLADGYVEVGGAVTSFDGNRFYIQDGESAVCVSASGLGGVTGVQVGDSVIVRGRVGEFATGDIVISATSVSKQTAAYNVRAVDITSPEQLPEYFASVASIENLTVAGVEVPNPENPHRYKLLVDGGEFRLIITFNTDASDDFYVGDVIAFNGVCLPQKNSVEGSENYGLYVLHVRNASDVIKQ